MDIPDTIARYFDIEWQICDVSDNKTDDEIMYKIYSEIASENWKLAHKSKQQEQPFEHIEIGPDYDPAIEEFLSNRANRNYIPPEKSSNQRQPLVFNYDD